MMKRNWMKMRRRRRRAADAWIPVGSGVGGAVVGAAIAYWLDPERGARRRAAVRQKVRHAGLQASETAEACARDLSHRGMGMFASARNRLTDLGDRIRGRAVDDEVLAQRVRAKLGRLCSHPSAVEVTCRDGVVELRGPMLKAEVKRVLRGVSKVLGVREIDNDLEPHDAPDVPELQGGVTRPAPGLFQEHWSPAARTVAGATGAGLVAFGAWQRNLLGAGVGLAGLGLLARSLTNLPARRIVGIGAGRRAIDLQKDLRVEAPVEEVFAFFERFENFPKFMDHVREVTPRGEEGRRWNWTVTGPAGVPVSWEAEVTRYVPNRVIAWKSVAGSLVRNAGIVRFEPDDGGTRLSVRLSYNPPGGALGHALVAALGAHPRKQLHEDLLRFKSLIESGKTTGRAGRVTQEQLAGGDDRLSPGFSGT